MDCHTFHVCDGGPECLPINTGEGLVCVITGRCLGENLQATSQNCELVTWSSQEPIKNYVFGQLVSSIAAELFDYFSAKVATEDLTEVSASVLDKATGSLKKEIMAMISHTFPLCHHLFEETPWAKDLVLSIYIHVIISIYSSRTVYDSLLFKCTKNKKYDHILKQIRESWMSTLTTCDT